MDLVTPGFGLIFWTVISFLILLFVLRKVAWKPILGAVSEREEGIKKALASAEEAKQEMKNLHSDNEKLLQQARAEREAMIKEAREIKASMIAGAKDEAQAEASKAIAGAQATIEAEKKAAVAELKQTVASLSLDIAEKIVKSELSNKDKQLELVETMLKDANVN
jgi:F-type H+-transporting ATPase subunit b|tara:strand:+ start:2281 stop:2775 length:495 start_codon:yes stop_codon:yes gene_type:complete